MAVRPVAENTYRVSAVVKVKGKTFKKVRERFIGTKLASRRLEEKLKQLCRKAANQYREELEHPYETLDRLIDLYVELKRPSDISTFRRLKGDCGSYEVNPVALKSKFLGGADTLGNPQKGYVQLLDYEHVRRYQRNGIGGDVVETNRLIGANTKNKIYRAIRNLCEFAVEQGVMKFNPIQQKIHWKEIPRSRTLSDDEIQKIIKAFTRYFPHYLPLFLHCSRNPCRIGDIRELTRDNLFLDERQIRYTSSKKKVPVVHIIYDDQVEYFQNLPDASKYLFYRPVKNKDTGETEYQKIGDFKKAWKRVLQECDIKDLTWHDLRHHSLTALFNDPEFTVRHAMLIGGWSQRSTIEIYHNIDAKRTAAELNDIILKKSKREK